MYWKAPSNWNNSSLPGAKRTEASLIVYFKVEGVEEPKLTKEDREFKQLMSDFSKTLEHNKKVQVQADVAKEKLIVATTNKIIKLSNENKELKTELNEIKAILEQ